MYALVPHTVTHSTQLTISVHSIHHENVQFHFHCVRIMYIHVYYPSQ